MFQAEFVFTNVFFAQLAPIAVQVAFKKIGWRLSGRFKGSKCAGGCDELAERKCCFHHYAEA